MLGFVTEHQPRNSVGNLDSYDNEFILLLIASNALQNFNCYSPNAGCGGGGTPIYRVYGGGGGGIWV